MPLLLSCSVELHYQGYNEDVQQPTWWQSPFETVGISRHFKGVHLVAPVNPTGTHCHPSTPELMKPSLKLKPLWKEREKRKKIRARVPFPGLQRNALLNTIVLLFYVSQYELNATYCFTCTAQRSFVHFLRP